MNESQAVSAEATKPAVLLAPAARNPVSLVLFSLLAVGLSYIIQDVYFPVFNIDPALLVETDGMAPEAVPVEAMNRIDAAEQEVQRQNAALFGALQTGLLALFVPLGARHGERTLPMWLLLWGVGLVFAGLLGAAAGWGAEQFFDSRQAALGALEVSDLLMAMGIFMGIVGLASGLATGLSSPSMPIGSALIGGLLGGLIACAVFVLSSALVFTTFNIHQVVSSDAQQMLVMLLCLGIGLPIGLLAATGTQSRTSATAST